MMAKAHDLRQDQVKLRWLSALYDHLVAALVPGDRLRRKLAGRLDAESALGVSRGSPHLPAPTLWIVRTRRDTERLLDARGTLSFPPDSVQEVVSGLMFIVSSTREKSKALKAAYRALEPGGKVRIMAWDRPTGPPGSLRAYVRWILRRFQDQSDLEKRGTLALMQEAGFTGIKETDSPDALFGALRLWEGSKPGRPRAGAVRRGTADRKRRRMTA